MEEKEGDNIQQALDSLQQVLNSLKETPDSLPKSVDEAPSAVLDASNEATDVFTQAGTWVETIGGLAWMYLPKVAMAILTVIIGFWVIKKANVLIVKGLERSGLAPEVAGFMSSFANALLKIVVLLAAAGMVGIEITAILGLLATAGIAVGLALQGSLSNFAAGILIMVIKPYRVGDWVEIQDKFGKVEDVQIFNTKIVSPGQKTLIIPNGQVIEGVVTNFSEKGVVRIELEVSMPYAESFPNVKKIIMKALLSIPEVLADPEPEIGIISYDSHNIIVGIRPFIEPDHYWHVTYEVYRKVKDAFHREGIQVAYSEGIQLGNIGD
ncbi:MAG: small conductance mechanosensitive channel [Saprospiraceae bacterium]|jgi:small conductance mechanosensitive channel